ncbi:MAG: hypothetical protein PHX51_07315 [Clostridia bacterium]|nr:hypothetical protein [Clostridia bacterium]
MNRLTKSLLIIQMIFTLLYVCIACDCIANNLSSRIEDRNMNVNIECINLNGAQYLVDTQHNVTDMGSMLEYFENELYYQFIEYRISNNGSYMSCSQGEKQGIINVNACKWLEEDAYCMTQCNSKLWYCKSPYYRMSNLYSYNGAERIKAIEYENKLIEGSTRQGFFYGSDELFIISATGRTPFTLPASDIKPYSIKLYDTNFDCLEHYKYNRESIAIFNDKSFVPCFANDSLYFVSNPMSDGVVRVYRYSDGKMEEEASIKYNAYNDLILYKKSKPFYDDGLIYCVYSGSAEASSNTQVASTMFVVVYDTLTSDIGD